MLSSTSVTTQSSWLLPLKSSAKPEWPDPELSLGRPCRDLGRNKCWEVAGPAQAVLDCIFPKVKILLESRNEYLNEKEPIPVAIIFGLYMIGRSEKKSNPTLLFTCEKKAPRRKALNVIMESELLSPFPGVLLAESARSPLSLRPAISLGSDEGVPSGPEGLVDTMLSDENTLLQLDIDFNFDFSNESLFQNSKKSFDIRLANSVIPADGPRGMLINIHSRNQATEPYRSATVGGFVYSENENMGRIYYGITVAHVFSHDSEDESSSQEDDCTEEDDVEFSFYGQGSDGEEQDEEFVEMTSRGSISPNLKSSPIIKPVLTVNKEQAKNFKPGMIKEPKYSTKIGILHQRPVLSTYKVAVTALALDTGIIGTLYASSEQGPASSLDWAMIELNAESIAKLIKLPCVNPSGIGTKQIEDRKVFTYSGSGRKLSGTMSSNQKLLKVPRAQTFQEVWVVRFDAILCKGDCGSWVVDDTTGELYGHLVAGHLESGLGYIVPAYQIIEDMQSKANGKLGLLHEPVLEDPFVPEYSELKALRGGRDTLHPLSQIHSTFKTGPSVYNRPQRLYEKIERLYKCHSNGCEKAFRTLNHLNAHITMQSHGDKRTEEDFKEARKELRDRKAKDGLEERHQFPNPDFGRISSIYDPINNWKAQLMAVGDSMWPITRAPPMKITTPASLMSIDSVDHFFEPISSLWSNQDHGGDRYRQSEANAAMATPNIQSYPSPALTSAASSPRVNKASAAHKMPQTSGRGIKRRSDIGSVEVSPALRPKISPSIKPLMPSSLKHSEDTASLLLASKSNYQSILEGTSLPGISYPTEIPTAYGSKRTSHKVAEQGRRNRINSALQEMLTLLPPGRSKDSGNQNGGSGSGDAEEGKEGNGVRIANSKSSTVELAIEYIKQLKQEVSDANKRAEDAEQELKLKSK